MTDKEQIIIDGVDVSKCCWCDIEEDATPYCEINDGEDLSCEDNPNCYFKQLARKTQECEELKEQLEFLQASSNGDDILIEIYMDKVYRLSKVLEESKNKLNEYERAGGILDEGEAWYHLAQRYEQALDEIEKISHYGTFKCVDCAGFNCKACTKEQFEIILDFINKAKGEGICQ